MAKTSRKRFRWLLWTFVLTIVILGGAAGAAWWKLPAIVTWAAGNAAADLGFEHVALNVDRADLSGLRVSRMAAEMGGLSIAVGETGADYALGRLMKGELGRFAAEKLVITLDFTKPRRSLLPDAVEELMSHFGGGGELVWPVDTLELKDSALVLVLPGGTEILPISCRMTKEPDGRVAFSFLSDHPQYHVQLDGRVRTETMDGEVRVQRLALQPGFLLGLARELGLFVAPEGVQFESDMVEVSGRAVLQAGAVTSAEFRTGVRRVHAANEQADVSLDGLVLTGGVGSAGTWTGKLAAKIRARAPGKEWAVGPAQIDLELRDGGIEGRMAAFDARWGENLETRLALDIEAGLPALGGRPDANVKLSVDKLAWGELGLAPLELKLAGWTNAVRVEASTIGLATASPATIEELAVSIEEPLGDAPNVKGALKLTAHPEALGFLPEGIGLEAPVLPTQLADVAFEVSLQQGKPVGGVRVSVDPGRTAVSLAGSHFSCLPSVRFGASIEQDRLDTSIVLGLDEIKTDLPIIPPGVSAASVSFAVPSLPVAAIGPLLEGKIPDEDLSVAFNATVERSAAQGTLGFDLRHHADDDSWSAGVTGDLDNVSGTWSGLVVDGLRLGVSLDTGRATLATIRGWLADGDWHTIVPALLPRVQVDVSASASSIEQPGTGRAEWLSLEFKKPAATSEEPGAVHAVFTANAGNLRAPPEVLEQPAVRLELNGSAMDLAVSASVQGMIEGNTLALRTDQNLAVDWTTGTVNGKGTFGLDPFVLLNSDIVSRWVPEMKDIAVSGTLDAKGDIAWSSDGAWSGTASLGLVGGAYGDPAMVLKATGIEGRIELMSLTDLTTAERQELRCSQIDYGEFQLTDSIVRFHAQGPKIVHIEDASTVIYGGTVSIGSCSLFFPDPDVAVVLKIDALDLGRVLGAMDAFNGSLTGRLSGTLPVGLLAGRPIVGEGYLELDNRFPASLNYDASGTFTRGMPEGGFANDINRLPYELLEDGLANLAIRRMRVELFQRDRPDTPVRALFEGAAKTERAVVPFEIEVNFNGTVKQVLDLFLKLAML